MHPRDWPAKVPNSKFEIGNAYPEREIVMRVHKTGKLSIKSVDEVCRTSSLYACAMGSAVFRAVTVRWFISI